MNKKVTVEQLSAMKQAGEKIASLTAYDASFARILDEVGIEIILIGDSLGMVLHGEADTLKVSMDDMVYHTRLVSRAARRALIMGDMPYMSYPSVKVAAANARRLLDEGGADVVKLEGADVHTLEIIRQLGAQGIPVCGHIGLQPQSVEKYGGYKVQGRDEASASRILGEARLLESAGVGLVVLECIPSRLARKITAALAIPTIGIGAGPDCDGQVLVLYDALGISKRMPRMAKDFLAEKKGIFAALQHYRSAVKSVTFPAEKHCFT